MTGLDDVLACLDVDPAMLRELGEIASELDGAREDERSQSLLERFRTLSGLSIPLREFQGIYGGMEHQEWVQERIATSRLSSSLTLSDEDALELIRRQLNAEGSEAEMGLALAALARAVHPKISDLIFWPDVWFGAAYDESIHREMTPEQILREAKIPKRPLPPSS